MIVTCPSCSAKYRVRDDAVPAEGAQLKCPECAQLFLAQRPKHNKDEMVQALERLTSAKEELERENHALHKRMADAESDFDRAKTEFHRANEEAGRALSQRDRELADMRGELERLRQSVANQQGQGMQLVAYEQRVSELTQKLTRVHDELERVRSAGAAAGPEVAQMRDQLNKAQTVAGRLTSELDGARRAQAAAEQRAQALEGQLRQGQSTPTNPLLEMEVQRLREQLAELSQGGGGGGVDANVMGLIAALAPMLWGLDQAIQYLHPFAATEPALATHVRQLQLLRGVLDKLAAATGNKPQ